jgi:hypothetical protein
MMWRSEVWRADAGRVSVVVVPELLPTGMAGGMYRPADMPLPGSVPMPHDMPMPR